eukprot:jgi/Astpho2/604/Aster-x0942
MLIEDEAKRNLPGHVLTFLQDTSAPDQSGYCASTLPSHFASVTHCNSRCIKAPPPGPLPLGERGFLPQVVPGTRVGAGGPAGFPTLKTLALDSAVRMAGVEVFGQPSKKESLILLVKDKLSRHLESGEITAKEVAAGILGERCWIKWPYLQEAVVVAVSDGKQTVDKEGAKAHDKAAMEQWHGESSNLSREFVVKHGLDVGQCALLLHVRPCEGLVRQVDGSIEKRFSPKHLMYPIQATLRRNPAPDLRQDATAMAQLRGGLSFEEGQHVLFLGTAHYGCLARILPAQYAGLNQQTPGV